MTCSGTLQTLLANNRLDALFHPELPLELLANPSRSSLDAPILRVTAIVAIHVFWRTPVARSLLHPMKTAPEHAMGYLTQESDGEWAFMLTGPMTTPVRIPLTLAEVMSMRAKALKVPPPLDEAIARLAEWLQ